MIFSYFFMSYQLGSDFSHSVDSSVIAYMQLTLERPLEYLGAEHAKVPKR